MAETCLFFNSLNIEKTWFGLPLLKMFYELKLKKLGAAVLVSDVNWQRRGHNNKHPYTVKEI